MEIINLDYTFNTRDLCDIKTTDGLYIKKNRLIRSGSLHKLSTKDIETLKNKDLRIVVDFRNEEEFERRPDIRIDNVTYINAPAFSKYVVAKKENMSHADANLLYLVDKESGGKKLLMNTYKDLFTTEKGINAYKEFFKVIQENKDGAVLWHCSQGKDRAGMASYLLLYALGVSEEDCIKDYLQTNIAMEKKIKELTPVILRISNNDTELLPMLREVFSADIEYVQEAIKVINETHGSIDNLLTNVLKVDIKKLRNNYLYSK